MGIWGNYKEKANGYKPAATSEVPGAAAGYCCAWSLSTASPGGGQTMLGLLPDPQTYPRCYSV